MANELPLYNPFFSCYDYFSTWLSPLKRIFEFAFLTVKLSLLGGWYLFEFTAPYAPPFCVLSIQSVLKFPCNTLY